MCVTGAKGKMHAFFGAVHVCASSVLAPRIYRTILTLYAFLQLLAYFLVRASNHASFESSGMRLSLTDEQSK